MTVARYLNKNRQNLFDAMKLALFTSFGTAVSLLMLGFEFGVNNNVFHIPYVLNLPLQETFVNDAFYQTLHYYTSAVWPIIRLIASENNVAWVFLSAHILSRAGAFLVLTILLAQLGVTRPMSMVSAIVVLAITPWLRVSEVGENGMFLTYFTHSELTWPFLIGSLLSRAQGKPVLSAAMAGITFIINAFVGIWLCMILCICWMFSSSREDLKIVRREIAIFLLIAAPVVVWIQIALQAPNLSETFSFLEYIRAYAPRHFLIEAATWRDVIRLSLILLAGLLATKYVRSGEFWRLTLAAATVVFVIGTAIPYIFDSRLVFALHLLRIDSVIQFISVVLVVAAAAINLQEAVYSRQRIIWLFALLSVTSLDTRWDWLLVLLLLLTPQLANCAVVSIQMSRPLGIKKILQLPVMGLASIEACIGLLLWLVWGAAVLLLGGNGLYRMIYLAVGLVGGLVMFFWRDDKSSSFVAIIILLQLLVFNALIFYQWRVSIAERSLSGDEAQVTAIAKWVRAHPIGGIVLLSKDVIKYGNFQLESRTRVWVDWKQGGAVMWYPPFYFQWMHRYKEVNALGDSDAIELYAKKNNIPYFVHRSEKQECPGRLRAVKASGEFALCATNPN